MLKRPRGPWPLALLLLAACKAPVDPAPTGRGPRLARADAGGGDIGLLWPDASSPDACSPGTPAPDASSPDAAALVDAGASSPDAASPVDAGAPSPDASPPDASPPDAASLVDAGASLDAGAPPPPAGVRVETPDRVRHLYSQLQAWSSDGTLFMGVDLDTSEAVVLDALTMRERARVGRVGPRWRPGTRAVLTFDDQPSTGAALFSLDVDTGVETELLRLGHPGLRAGRSHEELDRAGRWVAVYIDQARSGGPRIVTADVLAGRVGADVSIAELGCGFEPDWVGVDPSGRYLLVQSVQSGRGPCAGLWVHDVRTGAPLRNLTDHHNHGSTGLSADGRPYFLSVENAHPQDNNLQGVFRYWLDDGRREVVGAPLPWGAFSHVSCLGDPGAPCIVSGGNEFPSVYRGQLWRLEADGSRTVLEPHDASGCDDWGQAHGTAGPGGRYAFVTHGGDCARIRSVLAQ
jgi:hypothetical protein